MKDDKSSVKRKISYGSCRVDHFAPKVPDLGPTTQIINVHLSFAEANRLVFALQERLRDIFGLMRASAEAKTAAVNLVIHLSGESVAIMPGKLKAPEK